LTQARSKTRRRSLKYKPKGRFNEKQGGFATKECHMNNRVRGEGALRVGSNSAGGRGLGGWRGETEKEDE